MFPYYSSVQQSSSALILAMLLLGAVFKIMGMNFVINPKELRKALADIEKAEANGFKYCQSVFEIVSAGSMLDANVAEYDDMIEKAHPTDGSLDWGRGQNVTSNNKFVNGKLVRIKGR